MKKVIEEARKIDDEVELDLYLTDEELVKENEEYNYQLGYQDGIQGTKEEMVINFYNNKVPIEVIAKSANLSIKEVKNIINN